MKKYSSKTGKESGVKAFETGDDYIIIQFDTVKYKYSYNSCGRKMTETMKRLADGSEGLSTFISQHQPGYEWKL